MELTLLNRFYLSSLLQHFDLIVAAFDYVNNFGWAELAVACRQLGLGNRVRVYNSDTDAGTKAGVGSEGRTDSAIVRYAYTCTNV